MFCFVSRNNWIIDVLMWLNKESGVTFTVYKSQIGLGSKLRQYIAHNKKEILDQGGPLLKPIFSFYQLQWAFILPSRRMNRIVLQQILLVLMFHSITKCLKRFLLSNSKKN